VELPELVAVTEHDPLVGGRDFVKTKLLVRINELEETCTLILVCPILRSLGEMRRQT